MKQTLKITITAMLLILCCMTLVIAGEYKLPDTGIETCYNADGYEIQSRHKESLSTARMPSMTALKWPTRTTETVRSQI